MIRVTDLRKSYGSNQAVDGVSLEIRPGETFGLLGPNGAGKTTTIHMIVGVLRPDAGSVELNGQGSPSSNAARGRMGLAPQALALYDTLTAQENLAFFGRLYGLSGERLRQRVQWALEVAGLVDRRFDRVATFSGGMKRRLNLVAALVHDPAVLLLDEPTVGVDPQSRHHIFERIEALKKEGRTILYTTHYIEEAARLCDRVAIMDHGRIRALDKVDHLIAEHGGHAVIHAELERPPPPGVSLPGRLDDLTLRVETDRPLEEIGRLAPLGLAFKSLRIDRPDLETVFLNLTGRSLRD